MLSLIEETSGGMNGQSAMLLWRTPTSDPDSLEQLEAREVTLWL